MMKRRIENDFSLTNDSHCRDLNNYNNNIEAFKRKKRNEGFTLRHYNIYAQQRLSFDCAIRLFLKYMSIMQIIVFF